MDPVAPTEEQIAALSSSLHVVGQLVECWRQAERAWKEWSDIAKDRKRTIDDLTTRINYWSTSRRNGNHDGVYKGERLLHEVIDEGKFDYVADQLDRLSKAVNMAMKDLVSTAYEDKPEHIKEAVHSAMRKISDAS